MFPAAPAPLVGTCPGPPLSSLHATSLSLGEGQHSCGGHPPVPSPDTGGGGHCHFSWTAEGPQEVHLASVLEPVVGSSASRCLFRIIRLFQRHLPPGENGSHFHSLLQTAASAKAFYPLPWSFTSLANDEIPIKSFLKSILSAYCC